MILLTPFHKEKSQVREPQWLMSQPSSGKENKQVIIFLKWHRSRGAGTDQRELFSHILVPLTGFYPEQNRLQHFVSIVPSPPPPLFLFQPRKACCGLHHPRTVRASGNYFKSPQLNWGFCTRATNNPALTGKEEEVGMYIECTCDRILPPGRWSTAYLSHCDQGAHPLDAGRCPLPTSDLCAASVYLATALALGPLLLFLRHRWENQVGGATGSSDGRHKSRRFPHWETWSVLRVIT